MKGRIKMKKLLSLLLSLSMLASMAVIPAKAEETVMPLNASRIDSEKLPSGNLIYLGTASANVKEEDAVYSFPIYREGDLSEEASVTIHSLDLTAIYGEDYVILDDNAEKTGDGVSILERYATAKLTLMKHRITFRKRIQILKIIRNLIQKWHSNLQTK